MMPLLPLWHGRLAVLTKQPKQCGQLAAIAISPRLVMLAFELMYRLAETAAARHEHSR
jgi:hypothetical protein